MPVISTSTMPSPLVWTSPTQTAKRFTSVFLSGAGAPIDTTCYKVATLKRKLDQVAQLGCKAFALLFDDIEAEMSKPDKEAFQSFAAAQVILSLL